MTTRRQLFLGCAALSAPAATTGRDQFRYCLNTGTLQGYKLKLAEIVEVAAKAGFQAIEPWVNLIDADLGRRIADLGLTVEGAIGFSQWIVDDPAQRAKGLEQARRDMDLVARLGGKRIAAPPAGASRGAEIPLLRIAERYRALLDLGDRMGVTPVLEIWGQSANLHRLSEVVFVALETGHPKACVLPDMFHLYKGGSELAGLRMLSAQAVPVFHLNDYPADPPRATITDRDRLYPGDGVAPLKQILAGLDPATILSLELFNPAYWKGDPLETARIGLAKMKQAVQAAVA
jgi:sugar phosphate isomerase/epimerase